MKRKQPSRPFLGEVFRKLASKIGATVVMEPEWNFVGQITFKNGRRRYFRGSTIDLNPVGASDIAKDKDYAAFFMKRMGYPTVPGKTFFSSEFCRAIGSRRNIDSAYRYAMRIGFPVVVKPNSGSQGVGMAKVYTKSDFYRSLKFIFKNDRAALVQPYIAGKDYRIVVLDNKVISTYQRLPLNLMGDGRSTIHQLLIKKQNQFIARGRDTAIKADDPRIGQVLKRQGLSTRSVLQAKQRIYLLDNANLSSGGDALDVTNVINPEFKRVAIRLTKDMGLRLCGVDLIVEGDITKSPSKYWILEVNAAPGLDHYARTGRTQKKIVEDMYLKVLRAME